MKNTLFPAGLNDMSFEIYKRANQIYALNNGKTIAYEDFPNELLTLIDTIISLNPKARKAMEFIGVTDADEQRKQFISCNMANFDFTADVNEDYKELTTEYVECNIRKTCPVQDKLCGAVKSVNGQLSIRQLQIMGMIRLGMFDKEIADALFISQETVKTTKRNIQKILKVERKAMIANAAALMQIN